MSRNKKSGLFLSLSAFLNHIFHTVVKTLCMLDCFLCFYTLATSAHTGKHLSVVHVFIKWKHSMLLVPVKCFFSSEWCYLQELSYLPSNKFV